MHSLGVFMKMGVITGKKIQIKMLVVMVASQGKCS